MIHSDYHQLLFHNFYTVGGLNYSIFCAFSAIYLLTVRNKTSATRSLIFLMSILGSMAFAYFLVYLIPFPTMAYHRWVTVGVSIFGSAQVAVFFMYFPTPIWPRFRKWFSISTSVISGILLLIFIVQSFSAPKVYEFDGHYFDVDLPVLGRIVGLVILAYVLVFMVVGIIRIVKASQKWPVVFMLMGFLFGILVPGIFNMLSRVNAIDRELFGTVWNVSGVVGVFILLVTYVNQMTERSTILMKLYAVSLVVALLILQAVNFHFLRDRESVYNTLQLQKANRAIVDSNYRPLDLACFTKISLTGSSETEYKSSSNHGLCDKAINQQSNQVILFAYLNGQSIDSITSNLSSLSLYQGEGTIDWLKSIERSLRNQGLSDSEIRNRVSVEIEDNRSKILRIRGIIQRLPNGDLSTEFIKATKVLEKDPFVAPRLKAVLNLDLNEVKKNSFDSELLPFANRSTLLSWFPEPLNLGDRSYGLDSSNETEDTLSNKYITYFIPSKSTLTGADQLYQVDFKYRDYRTYIDQGSSTLNNLQVVTTVLILIGYPVFFFGALLRPLRRLLGGVEDVNRGNLDIQIPVRVEDEIGYLSRSFNSMVTNIRSARQELKDYADQLEIRVQERTEELQNTLEEVQTLKEIQDGDYFLTSLLLKPLSANHVPIHSSCSVDFVVRQKKQFTFRKWNEEIGGDLCTAHQLTLRERSYIFAVNADAMGKSIQGAGGALVLGAVLESLVERTKYSNKDRDLPPEQWLKLAFIELHRVFESFNGSMLVSLVMSLVDEENGFVYFINAEHPVPVLVRNGQASFVEQEEPLRKLGMTGMTGFISIQTFLLQPGDILVFGSDGKDDLVMEHHGDSRVINEDEGLFLKIASQSSGDPKKMAAILVDEYELMDDLSLLAIRYHPDEEQLRRRRTISRQLKQEIDDIRANKVEAKEGIQKLVMALEQYPDNMQLHRQLASLYLKTRQFGRAIIHMEKYLILKPDDNEMLYRIFMLMKKRNLLVRAADYGEIYHLRHPADKRIAAELADLYQRTGNREREEKFRALLATM